MKSATPAAAIDSRGLRQEDLDFATHARQAMKGDRVTGANLLLLVIFLCLAGFVTWASMAEIDEVTKAAGKVIPSSSVQTIQNLEGGIVAEILISEGDAVRAGQVLVRIDDTLSSSSFREDLARAEALRAALVRLTAEARDETELVFPEDLVRERPDLVKREKDLFEKRGSEREEQRAILERSHRLASEELTMTIPLVQKNIVSKVEQLRLERDLNEVEGKLKELIGGFQQSAMEKYNEAKAELDALQEALEGRQDRVQRTIVKSPVDGTVNELYVSTIGGVVQPGEPIVDIVPRDDTLLVEAKVRPSDIAFIRPGQEAVLKLTAYDFALFGGLKGEVETISADTIEDEIDRQHYYMIKVRNRSGKLEKNGEELPVITGMVAEVDILTGRRTVLQYLLKPFHRMRFNSLGER